MTYDIEKSLNSLRNNTIKYKGDMSDRELSRKIGMEETYMSKFLQNDFAPSLSVALNLANVFGVSLDELLSSNDNRSDEYFALQIEMKDATANELRIASATLKAAKAERNS